MKICEKSKQVLKFYTTVFEDETLSFQLSDKMAHMFDKVI